VYFTQTPKEATNVQRKKMLGRVGAGEVFTLIAKTRTPFKGTTASVGRTPPQNHPAGQQKETQTATLDHPPSASNQRRPPPPDRRYSTKCCLNVIQYFFNLVAIAGYFFRPLLQLPLFTENNYFFSH